jgi:3-isopropylmalate dehydratase small subunit
MQKYTNHTSVAALMNRSNVDTDQIIAKQFLKKVERTGFGQHLFHDWRFHEDGTPNAEFELNNPNFDGAKVLVAITLVVAHLVSTRHGPLTTMASTLLSLLASPIFSIITVLRTAFCLSLLMLRP